MDDLILNVHLSIEKQGLQEIDYRDDYTDVIVEMLNGDLFVASFFTFQNIKTKEKTNKEKKLFLNGKYFWADRMIITNSIDRKTINEVIEDLLEEGNFFNAFKRI